MILLASLFTVMQKERGDRYLGWILNAYLPGKQLFEKDLKALEEERKKFIMKKILIIVLGILTIVSGIVMIANPGLALPVTGAMLAAGMFMFSLVVLLTWFSRRDSGETDVFSLIMAILGFIFSLLFLFNIWAQMISAEMLFYMELFFMVVEGVILIADSFRIRKLKDSRDPVQQDLGHAWGLVLASGILMIIAGIFALCHPLGALVVNGVYMGIEIVVAGIVAIIWAFKM